MLRVINTIYFATRQAIDSIIIIKSYLIIYIYKKLCQVIYIYFTGLSQNMDSVVWRIYIKFIRARLIGGSTLPDFIIQPTLSQSNILRRTVNNT